MEFKVKGHTFSNKQELFRFIEKWKKETGRSLSEWKKTFEYKGPNLKGRGQGRVSFEHTGNADNRIREVRKRRLTPDPNRRAAADKVVKGINYFGEEADHILSLKLLEAGQQSYNDPARQALMRQRYQDAGIGYGHDPKNLQPLEPELNAAKNRWEQRAHSSKGYYQHLANKPDVTSPDFPEWENARKKIAASLEIVDFKGGTVKFKGAGSVLPLVGVAAGVMSAGQAFAAGDPQEGAARLLETGAGEVPVVGDVIQPEAVAGGTFEDVERRTAEGLRAKQLQQRAAEARQRGGKLSFGVGGVRFALPEFGLSELMGIN